MQGAGFGGLLGEQRGHVVGVETVLVVGKIVVDQHHAVVGEHGVEFGPAEGTQHGAYLLPVERPVVGDLARFEQALAEHRPRLYITNAALHNPTGATLAPPVAHRLLTLAADVAAENGFTLMITPTLVNPDIMAGTGFLGAHSDEIYYLPADDQYLVGTSEVALAGYHKDEILDLSKGPLRYAGWSSCYRREAGSYGKDTRGIIRVHQFNKVEMFVYCRVEDSMVEHQRLLNLEEQMLKKMELPYRVINTAAGDLGSSAAQKFDCEAWLPTQNRFMEVTSTSNCTTYQARRLNTRERFEGENTPVATLNGTLATTRWLVAMLENYQQADGSIRIPEALRPYLGGKDHFDPVA